ncbi:MAG TPA: chromosomal replication initiator protein DnaA [Firmicutes bacterium]|nr:chromosomal replication initiator protein DnaA [Bacillota bacterium]
MDSELEQLWDRALHYVQTQILKPSFDTWLKQSKPLALYGDTLVIGLQNDFAREWVQSHYSEQLREALKTTSRRSFNVKFVISPRSNDSPASQEDQEAPVLPELAATCQPCTQAAPQAAQPCDYHGQRLNPKYTFDTFVVGPSNRLAHAACLAVAEEPAKAYNPLFIYGGVGLGKTHLMQAIGHYSQLNYPNIKVVYVSSETFTNELIMAIRQRDTMEFRNRYRNVDILLIDDIQFLAGKEGTQEEFFHTFDALHHANKQIVISSDRPPREIATLEERLRTRFEWGLICDIQPPDLETRIAILRNKAALDGVDVPPDVIHYIASRIETNIRELEGALIRVVAYASMNSKPVDIDLTIEALKHLVPPDSKATITLSMIQEAVASYYSLSPEDLTDKKRNRSVAFPRQVAMYLCRVLTDASLPVIGQHFGGRDHTTVLHAFNKISEQLRHDPALAETIESLTHTLKRKTAH